MKGNVLASEDQLDELRLAVIRSFDKLRGRMTKAGAQEWIGAGETLDRWLEGLLPRGGIAEPAALPEPTSSIIRVDRSVKPSYPDWMKKVMHPELELTGAPAFDASKLELWLHEKQEDGWVKGKVIYEYLKKKEMLEGCLGLTDLLAIQAKGIAFFRQHFAGKAVFGWKSVVQRADGYLLVPYAYDVGDWAVVPWYWLDSDWLSSHPALRFGK